MNHSFLWALGGLCVGFVLGYIVSDKLGQKKSEEVLFETAEEKIERDAELQDYRFKEEERKKAEKIAEGYGYSQPKTAVKLEEEDDDIGPDDDDPVEEPIVITEDEFRHDYLEAESAGLTYYQQDDVLTDPDGEPIYDIRETIGEDAEWVVANTEDDTVYVYNDEYGTKYEITVDHHSAYYNDDCELCRVE